MRLTMARAGPSKIIMSPARILVMENQQVIARALARPLERLGYVVVGIATSGPEAIA
jgi:CheY-like chemotaxis protein